MAFGRVIKWGVGKLLLGIADGDDTVEPSRSVFGPSAGPTSASNFKEGLDGCERGEVVA